MANLSTQFTSSYFHNITVGELYFIADDIDRAHSLVDRAGYDPDDLEQDIIARWPGPANRVPSRDLWIVPMEHVPQEPRFPYVFNG